MKRRLVGMIFGAILVLFSTLSFVPVEAAIARDCDANAIMHCGAATRSELSRKTTGDITAIYAHYGIQKAHFSTLADGTVYSDGRVVVGGKTVATNAVSTGRHNMAGSTAVTAGGVRIYERPTSVSFRSASLPAFVKMTNGKFQYAIIKSCGNPTKGKPTPEPEKPKNPKIDIKKDVSKAVVEVGEEFTYTIRVRNIGDVDFVNARVNDGAPTNIEFIPGSGNSGTMVTRTEFRVTIPSLKKGEVKTYTFKAKFTQYVKNIVNNEACVVVEKPKPLSDCDKAGNRPKKPPVPEQPEPEKPEEPEPPVEQPAPLTPVTYTKEIPSTGPAEIIGGGMGISSATYGVVSYIRSRRNLRDLFRK